MSEETFYTVRELAAKLGISRQAAEKRLKRLDQAELAKHATQQQRNGNKAVAYDETVLQKLLERAQATTTATDKATSNATVDTVLQGYQEAIRAKDETIAALRSEVETLKQQLDGQAATVQALTTALQAEQALHADTKQKTALLESKQGGGLFGRIFGRNRKDGEQ